MPSILATSCRACLKESLEDFFEMNKQCHFSRDNHNFGDIFNICTHIQIQTNDGLPQIICALCVQDLQQTFEFLQRVALSDKKLKTIKERNIQETDHDYNHGNDDSIKDPLENITDHEGEEDTKSDMIGGDDSIQTPLDNADNNFDDALDTRYMSPPHYTDSDKDDNDFLVSVESQIFPQGRFICKICQKAYFTNVGLQAHMDIHSPKSKTISKDTAKSVLERKRIFKQKKVPKVHNSDDENTQDEELLKSLHEKPKDKLLKPKKMFPCQVCGKQMISASKLRYHMVMHTGEKDYLCTMCPKAYSTIYALKHHMRAHTGERPYECKFCGDRFLRPTTLKSHMRRHTGERPYGCDICGKRFIQHSSMATHMKLNHMDKTISCPYCDKKYARQTDLNTHLLSHSGDKPFACQLCPSRFTRQSNLNKHMNQHHSNENAGGKKMRKKALKSEIADDLVESNISHDEDLPASVEHNKMSSTLENTFETPSCSSRQTLAKQDSTSLEHSSPPSSFYQNTASTSQLSEGQLNRWNWPSQTET